MSQKAITIYTPSGSEPHISADDDAFIHHSLLGGRSGMLGKLVCTRVDDNTVRLSGGGVSNRGFILRVPEGECYDLTVENGAAGVNRIDIVAARFTKGGADNADKHEFTVIRGTSAAEPVPPALVSGELASIGDICELALFHVRLSGTSIESITPVCADASVPASAHGFADPVRLTLTGDVRGSAAVDGTKDVSLSASIPMLSGMASHYMELTASQKDAFELVRSKWSGLPARRGFIIYVNGGDYGNSSVFIGEKTSAEYGCMMRLCYTFNAPLWYHLCDGTWSARVLGTV